MAKNIPFHLLITQKKGYLSIEYGGTDLTLQNALDIINISAHVARTQEARNVLLIRNMPLITSDEDRRMFAALVQRSVDPNVRFAMVDKYGNDPKESAKGLAVLRSVGWDVTEFPKEKDAVKWLTEK